MKQNLIQNTLSSYPRSMTLVVCDPGVPQASDRLLGVRALDLLVLIDILALLNANGGRSSSSIVASTACVALLAVNAAGGAAVGVLAAIAIDPNKVECMNVAGQVALRMLAIIL